MSSRENGRTLSTYFTEPWVICYIGSRGKRIHGIDEKKKRIIITCIVAYIPRGCRQFQTPQVSSRRQLDWFWTNLQAVLWQITILQRRIASEHVQGWASPWCPLAPPSTLFKSNTPKLQVSSWWSVLRLLISATKLILQTYHGTWSWRGEEGSGHLVSGCLDPGVHQRMDGLMLPTVTSKASGYVSDNNYSLCKTMLVQTMQWHSQQLTEGLVNTAIVWKQDLLLQQAFFCGRSDQDKKVVMLNCSF
jgi:hypothetical protein